MVKSSDWIIRFQPFFLPLAILLGGLAIALAIILTGGLELGSKSPADEAPVDQVEISVGDGPGLGDPNAPLTMIEFSDYECPYCQGFFETTLVQLKEQYINTGKLRFVYRDLPLSFHDPAATKEAIAARCARDQNGDEGYFLYHDEIFTRTAANGEGMKDADYAAAASKIGLDVSAFNSCLSSEKFKEAVQADLNYILEVAQNNPAAFPQGVGTPTFFIGRTDPSGTFMGTIVQGAQPFEVFQQIIEELLSQ